MSVSYRHCQFLWSRAIPAKAGIQETRAMGLDARRHGHDALLVSDLRNGHLGGIQVPVVIVLELAAIRLQLRREQVIGVT